jgi:hypothetical protein
MTDKTDAMVSALRAMAADMQAALGDGIGGGAAELCAVCQSAPADPVLLAPGGGHACGRCWELERVLSGSDDVPAMPWEMGGF